MAVPGTAPLAENNPLSEERTTAGTRSRDRFKDVYQTEVSVLSSRESLDRKNPSLVGMALSGGGIRSATFALGVLETLRRLDVLSRLDYLSTVGGGSHIGAWLTANCRRSAAWLRPDKGNRRWLESIAHLRRHAKSSSSSLGLFSADGWSNATAWLRNTALTLAAVVLALAMLLVLPRLLFELFIHLPEWPWMHVATTALVVLGGMGMASNLVGLNVLHRREFNARWPWLDVARDFFQGVVVLPLVVAAVGVAAALWVGLNGRSLPTDLAPSLSDLSTYGALLTSGWRAWPYSVNTVFGLFVAVPLLGVRGPRVAGFGAGLVAMVTSILLLNAFLCVVVLLMAGWRTAQDGVLAAFIWGPAGIMVSVAATIVIQAGMLGQQSSGAVNEWCNRVAAWLAIYAAGWTAMTACAIHGPWLFDQVVTRYPWQSLTFAASWFVTFTAGLLGGRSGSTGSGNRSLGTAAQELGAALAPFLFITGLLVVISYAVQRVILLNVASSSAWGHLPASAIGAHGSFMVVSLLFLGACATLLVIVASRIDVNEFSLTALHRKRLVRSYLRPTREGTSHLPTALTEFDDSDDIELAQLAEIPGPLHVINTALSFRASTGAAPEPGESASFTLTPLYCGSSYPVRGANGKVPEVGYVRTPAYGPRPLTLGQAMAISGAAANPNVGYHPAPAVAFLLTLFNLRFGWWLPNPHRPNSRIMSNFSLRAVLTELFGGASGRSRFLMVVDGGHFDNLGLYELVKRRCRVIFVVDADFDPDLTCPALTRAMQLCERDFGVTIRLNLAPLRVLEPHARESQPFAVGTVTYQDESVATLIYMKAVMAGIDDTALANYKARRPAFPHEDVGLGFESDDQFDSYRRLGQQVAERTFTPFLDAKWAVDWNLVRFPAKLVRPLGGKPRVFISYRRSDAAGYAQLLHTHVSRRFTPANVFIDVDGIKPGRNYPNVLHATLQSCDVALVVIGPGWLSASANGGSRLQEPGDWVRQEIGAVLSRDVLVVPVLVGGARVPDASDLPGDIAPLAERQGVALPDRGLTVVLDSLLDDLEAGIESGSAYS